MTYEQAAYFKLLLLCGYGDELQKHIDDALANLNPIPDIVLELAFAGSDDKKLLTVLGDYLSQVKDSDIDYDGAVFDMLIAFLQRKYREPMPTNALVGLMHRLALCSEQRIDREPWNSMDIMEALYAEAECGYIDMSSYLKALDEFINNRICLTTD